MCRFPVSGLGCLYCVSLESAAELSVSEAAILPLHVVSSESGLLLFEEVLVSALCLGSSAVWQYPFHALKLQSPLYFVKICVVYPVIFS